MPQDPELNLTFLGGADEIGASSTLVRAGETTLLIDCGIRFQAGRALPDLDELTGHHLDGILVTHAHTDHTGALPVIHEAYPAVPIHMSPPTAELVRILLRDALRLMAMGWESEGEVPLYSEEAVESTLAATVGVPTTQSFTIGEIEVTFLPASHILGASMIHLATPAGHVLFTGDYSVEAQRTVPALDRPPLPVDLVVTESTYGDRLHADRKPAERRLVERVGRVVADGGRVLIPAFAIGRAQEVLLILRQALERRDLPKVPVFVDGMVRAVCEVYRRFPRHVTNSLARRIDRGHPFYNDWIRPVASHDERRDVLAAGPCVIVASSGMLSGGPSAFYAGEMAGNERDAILITGYQDEESPGRKLLELAGSDGPGTLRIGEKEVEVRCAFEPYKLSAHADRIQMVGLLESLRPRCVVLVHGDAGAKARLAGSLGCRDIVHAANGTELTRRYPVRRARPPASRPEIEIDAGQARNLVAGAPGGILRVHRVAESWFGRRAPKILRERLVRRLEELGVVARDDHRRGLLRVLVTDSEEDALTEKLKERNPKGRLLEYCMRLGVEPPTLEKADLPGGRCRAELEFTLGDRLYASGPHEASNPKLAEQLAADALLEILAKDQNVEGVQTIDEEKARLLKRQNPKGLLLEHCSRSASAVPSFHVHPVPDGGFLGRASLVLDQDRTLESRPYRTRAARIAEQAAAADLLDQLARADPPAEPGEAATTPEAQTPPREERGRQDPRVELNRALQLGTIEDLGYELTETRGPPHRPEFVMRAWADVGGGVRTVSDPVTARSRKEAERLAAGSLLDRLRES